MAQIALTHIARGSQGALYFQWRASRGGAEQWHPALVGHTGTLSPETISLGALLSRLKEVGRLGGGSLLRRSALLLGHDASIGMCTLKRMPVASGAPMARIPASIMTMLHPIDL